MTAPAAATGPRATPVWLVAFFAALALFATTADRGIQWQDSGWQQLRIISGRIDHMLGLALTHPLQYHLGRAMLHVPGIDPPWACTLLSVISSAIAVANVATLVFILTRQRLPAAVGAISLALAHTFWQNATQTESYGLVAALLSAEWLCLARHAADRRGGWLLALALFNGLGVATHLLAGLATPMDLIIIASAVRAGVLKPSRALLAAIVWLVASLPYTGLVVATGLQTGDWSATLRSALFGDYAENVLNVRVSAGQLLTTFGYILYNLPNMALPLALFALARTWRRNDLFHRTLRWQAAIYFLFAARYSIADQYSFFFPVYMILAVFAGIGLAEALAGLAGRKRQLLVAASLVSALWPPVCYALVYPLASSRDLLHGRIGDKPYRDGYRSLLIPWSAGQHHARELNRQLARLSDDRTLIFVEDIMVWVGVRCAQELGELPRSTDIEWSPIDIRDPRTPERIAKLRAAAAGRTVILVPRNRDISPVIPGVDWQREGDVYRLAAPIVSP